MNGEKHKKGSDTSLVDYEKRYYGITIFFVDYVYILEKNKKWSNTLIYMLLQNGVIKKME